MPADLLAHARKAWDDALNLGEVNVLPQRTGNGARSYRDHLFHDGLRHDRGRAGLLAREVEEARRRRRDHDREPQDRPARLGEARLLAERDRRDRRLHRRAEHDRRGAVREDRALPRLRLRDRRAGRPPHRPRQDDGRDPAVHLRGDLEDRQPARGDHGGRGCAGLSRRVEARREGGRDLSRQLQGRPAALGQVRQKQGVPRAARHGRAVPQAPAGRSPRGRPQVPTSASTRATSTSACSTTARPATSSWTSRRKGRRSPAS